MCRANLKYRERRFHDDGGPIQEKFSRWRSGCPDLEPEAITADDNSRRDIDRSATSSSNHPEVSFIEDLVCGRQSLSFASRPDVARHEPFQCSYCHYVISMASEYWIWHVLSDMRAWACVFPDCKTCDLSYGIRYEWVVHMERDHLLTNKPGETHILCPLCQENVHRRGGGYHFEDPLRNLALFATVDPFALQESG